MAIYGIGGKPGSGKTYWVVNHIVSKYFQWDKVLSEWLPKVPVAIISNVEELRLDHYLLDEMIEKAGGRDKFFTVEYQRDLLKRFPKILYIIDEAGSPKYFPTHLKNDGIVFLFQYHRHLGIDFYLIAPGVSNICTQIVRLMEYRIQASARSKRLTREFRYQKVVEGDQAGKQVLIWNKDIFKLYKSMTQDEGEKPGSLTRKYIIITGVMLTLAIVGGLVFVNNMFGGLRKNKKLEIKKSEVVKKEVEKVKENIDEREKVVKITLELPSGDRVRGVREVSAEEIKEYERLFVKWREDGLPVFHFEDGEMLRRDLLPFVIKDCVVHSGLVYVKRIKRGAPEQRESTPFNTKTDTSQTIKTNKPEPENMFSRVKKGEKKNEGVQVGK